MDHLLTEDNVRKILALFNQWVFVADHFKIRSDVILYNIDSYYI